MDLCGGTNNRKAAVIGCGFVGSASAFALMQSGLFTDSFLLFLGSGDGGSFLF